MDKLKISACVIVRNEERNMKRWLQGAAVFADEILVVDTGSTDRTCALAREGGARLRFFPWCDDFAAAKNYALQQATGNWIVFLDADEYFTESSSRALREVLKELQPQKNVAGLISHYRSVDPERHNCLVGSGWQIRIFRNLPAIRFQGRVHEALRDTGSSGIFQRTELTFIHTGYTMSRQQAKCARNLAILQKMIAEQGGERAGDYTYLTDCYMGLGQYDRAIHYARLAIEYDAQSGILGQLRKNYGCLFTAMQRGSYPEAEQEEALLQAAGKYPDWGELYWYQGYFYFQCMDYERAEPLLQRTVEMADLAVHTGNPLEDGGDELEAVLPHVYYVLGCIAKDKGQQVQAVQFWQDTLRRYPYHALAFRAMYRLLQEQPAVEIIEFLGQFYEREADRGFLAQELELFPYTAVYLYYVMPEPKSYAAAMAAGKYSLAARIAAYPLRGLDGMQLQQEKRGNDVEA